MLVFLFVDPIRTLKLADRMKHNHYDMCWHASRPNAMVHAASMSLHGVMSPELISELHHIASVLVNCDTPHLSTHDWDIPSSHILVGLMAQGFRTRLARSVLVASLHSLRNMFIFAPNYLMGR